mgnify:CR=1 FL=1
MELTFEEQAYHDEFVKVYNRYGDKIPDNEWLRLRTLREGLNVGFQQSRKIIEIVELESYEKKYFEQHPEKQLSKVIVNVTPDTIVSQHDSIREKRKHDISDFKNKKKKLEEDLNVKENLKVPEKVEDPGELNFFRILLTYAIGAYLVWGLDWFWVGIILLTIESLIVFEKYCHISRYKKYKDDLDEYHSTEDRLKYDIPQLKMEIGYLNTVISENLFSEINSGCSIPIPRKAINENTWEEMDGKLDDLVASYSQYKDASAGSLKKEMSRNFFNKKLEFFYNESIRNEAGCDVYKKFEEQLHRAISTMDFNLLRMDFDEKALLVSKEYDFSTKVQSYKGIVEKMDISYLMKQYDIIKDMETSGFLGFTNIDKLASKTQNLQKLYAPIKGEYDRLRKVSDEVNYYLTFVRTVAYRNIYLGVELLNYIRDNAGGKSLISQKDKVDAGDTMNVDKVTSDRLQMDSMNNVANTLSGLVSNALEDKQLRKFVMNNPKMATGAAALAVVGNLLGERIEKIENNNELQKQLITSISQMVDGYNSGKAGLLRAIEVIKALSKANIGFLAIYAPLRDKFFVEECTTATMMDLQNLAKATQEYKHISDTKL